MHKISGKLTQFSLGIGIETIYNFRTWDKRSTKVSTFFYLTLGRFLKFFQVIWRVLSTVNLPDIFCTFNEVKRCIFVFFCEFLEDVRFLENLNNHFEENFLKSVLEAKFQGFRFFEPVQRAILDIWSQWLLTAKIKLGETSYGWRSGAKFTKFIFIHIQGCDCYSRIYLFPMGFFTDKICSGRLLKWRRKTKEYCVTRLKWSWGWSQI